MFERSACEKWQASDGAGMSITNRLLVIAPDKRRLPCLRSLKVLGEEEELTCNDAPFTINAPSEIKLTVDSGTQTASDRVRKASFVANNTSPDPSIVIDASFLPV